MTSVHRLLDQAFADIPLTPEAADLKEELRTGLVERVAELQASGTPAEQAALSAVAELGDVRAMLADDAAPAPDTRPAWSADLDLVTLNKVRPRPGFVVGIVVAGLVVVGAVVTYALLAARGSVLAPALLAVVAGLGVGWILGTSLAQETTTNHPLPRTRATAWGAAGALVTTGIGTGLVALPAWGADTAVAWIVVGGLLLVVGAVLFTWLGVTQTNRRKAWTRQLSGAAGAADNFSRDPALAARFGIYTGVIWVSAFLVSVVVGFSVGWRYSWLAYVVGWIVMMVMLARMNFGPGRPQRAERTR
ncbi:hypothetical protein Xcel_2077 [Xylanimonas cellulosilytica DSM 15894]|uniref:Uncharacterized protein n=1 Tax=Xylanimonas cellulosilytica (strain DSM 15894 / JCM 12276 / CECT 5975 / KCTC 9989 / LMG 20990 / NBRC 107835 / XIL07) TaxID=446471 RepID=D1BU82_XYLCX|nr:permease prefix domain 1-containing protein [Xylanimonas cellulosilytica]ACZ31095.1 hypothetical protein Xcel_2077 [Xylanimonas cellulosilytica DSM 15894]